MYQKHHNKQNRKNSQSTLSLKCSFLSDGEQFLNNVIISKTKIHLIQAYATLAAIGYPMCFFLQRFQINWLSKILIFECT